jgi:hypothetical protein
VKLNLESLLLESITAQRGLFYFFTARRKAHRVRGNESKNVEGNQRPFEDGAEPSCLQGLEVKGSAF